MTDRALTKEAVLSGLQDIRLPPEASGGLVSEVLAVIGLALILAVLISLGARLVTRSPPGRPRKPGLRDRAAALSDLPGEERRVALLHLLKATRPDAFRALAADLYAPGGLPDLAELEAEVGRNG